MARREPPQPDVIGSGGDAGRSLPGRLRRPARVTRWSVAVLSLALVAAGVWTVLDDSQQRSQAGRVLLDVHAFVPFGGGPGGWSGTVEIRNRGARSVAVLGLALQRPGVDSDVSGVPLQIEPGAVGTVRLRLSLDCAAVAVVSRGVGPYVQVRARNAGGVEVVRSLASRDLSDLLTQLAHDQCGAAEGAATPGVEIAYAGSRIRDGGLETTVTVRNDQPGLVDVLDITAASGWPAAVHDDSSPVLASVPAGGSAPVRLRWEVAACPRLTVGAVVSSVRAVLVVPDRTFKVEVHDLGRSFAADFFRLYHVVCPGSSPR